MNPDIYLCSTPTIDFESRAVQDFVAANGPENTNNEERAIALYYAVRDQVRYDPYTISEDLRDYSASVTLATGRGWCVTKAILYAACCRALGIPARLGYADVRNHMSTSNLRRLMGTDIFYWHGYTEVYLNNKGGNRNWPAGIGCYEKDNLKLEVIGPKWQSCTTFGTSFGYLAAEGDPDYPHKKKSVEQVIHEMVEIISRNGNFLINIGPRADGTIPAWQVERLRAMGKWLEINGDAIYGSRYWKENEQEDEQLSFTTNGKKLYAIKRARPGYPFVIEATAGWEKKQVKSVRLLGSDADVAWEMTSRGLRIIPPEDLGESMHAWSFEIRTNTQQHHPNIIQNDASKALEGTKKVELDGHVKSN